MYLSATEICTWLSDYVRFMEYLSTVSIIRIITRFVLFLFNCYVSRLIAAIDNIYIWNNVLNHFFRQLSTTNHRSHLLNDLNEKCKNDNY